MNKLKIKVCGMRDPKNIAEVVKASPDFIGFVFYPKSKRFAGVVPDPEVLKTVPAKVRKVGVFVNEKPEVIRQIIKDWALDVVQLHGQETPEDCMLMKQSGTIVFKAFSVDKLFDFSVLDAFCGSCDYFLFDTKGHLPGGTGQKFNWQLLENYRLEVPFFLSGGIVPDDVQPILEYSHPHLFGIDINSGFEISPALKNAETVKQFISRIKSQVINNQS